MATGAGLALLEFLAERAAYVTYGDGQTSIRWQLGTDAEKHLHVPGI